MEEQILDDSLKSATENCSQMDNNSQLLSNYSNVLKKQPFDGQSFVQIEQLRTLSSHSKDILLHHGILNDKNEAKTDQDFIVISNCLRNNDYGNLSETHLAKLREIHFIWMELHKCIRFVYKNAVAVTPCMVFNEKIPDAITNAIRAFSKRLCDEDCQQLFIRLEVLLKDFVLEARDHLNLRHNANHLPQNYIKCLLASYGAFCIAAENLTPCIPQLNTLLMSRLSVNILLLNKYLFFTCLFTDVFVEKHVLCYISQLKTLSPEAYFTNQELLHSFTAFEDEMADIAAKWVHVKQLILEFSRIRVRSNPKQSLLLDDWEVFKENQELTIKKIWQLRSFNRDLADFDVQLLSLLDEITINITDMKLSSISKKDVSKTTLNCAYETICPCNADSKLAITYLVTPPASPIQDSNFNFGNSQILQKYNAISQEKEDKHLLVSEKQSNDIIIPKNFLKLINDKTITKIPDKIKNVDKLEEKPITKIENIPIAAPAATANKFPQKTDIPVVKETEILTKVSTEKDMEPRKTSLQQHNHNHLNTKKKLKSDLSCKNTEPQGTLKANKENKHCDCPHCEVFENTNVSSLTKNKTRDRLRLRLNEKQNQANKEKISAKKTVEKAVKIETTKVGNVETKAAKLDLKTGKVDTKLGKVETKTGKVETKSSGKITAKSEKIDTKSDKTNKSKSQVLQREHKNDTTNDEPDVDTRNIRDLINFIEGIDLNAKLINAQKKAAKKARRREKKLEEERLKQEEIDRIATEKAQEEERKLKERLMKEQAVPLYNKKGHKHDKPNKNSKHHKHQTKSEKKPVVVQPTPVPKPVAAEIKQVGPMVTIKRLMECTNSEPTVTITLKGSTPDKDKLLYTLVNGQTDLGKSVDEIVTNKNSHHLNNNNTNSINNNIKKSSNNSSTKKKKKNLNREQTKLVTPTTTTATINKSNNSNNLTNNKKQKNNNKNQPTPPPVQKQHQQPQKVAPKAKEQKNVIKNTNTTNHNNTPKSTNKTVTITVPAAKKIIPVVQSPTKLAAKQSASPLNLQMLRLPPGITITKVDGPTVSRKIQNTKPNQPELTVQTSPIRKTDNRSGVIVVDTVQLQDVKPVEQPKAEPTKKKNKRKNKNKPTETNNINPSKASTKLGDVKQSLPLSYKLTDVSSTADIQNINGNSIVTIKNPLFYQLQESLSGKLNKPKCQPPPQPKDTPKMGLMQQASIIRGANGMVTIRSPSLGTQTMQPCTDYTELIRPNQAPSIPEYKSEVMHTTAVFKPAKTEKKKPFNAQEILGGLPGIEITKVNNKTRNKHESKVYQPADVSIIPTNIANGTNGDVYKLFSDNVDWSLESVFAPKDIKEDEVLDDEELELEAFKRFCQQSVPPKRKEKVAHLNVKDIVLKKKNC